jgi:hypothetical protein
MPVELTRSPVTSDFMEGKVGLHQTHEHVEQAERAQHHEKKRTALLIICVAVALAIVEMAGKEAQFSSIANNIQAADLYAFYQAKTIRGTVVRTALENIEVTAADGGPATEKQQKQLASWKATLDRWDSEPSTREGRKELLERAREVEKARDHEMHAYHVYEYSAAALQLAIVIASASIIIEITYLELAAAAFGLIGIGFALLGWLEPGMLA